MSRVVVVVVVVVVVMLALMGLRGDGEHHQ
jgi:hypothetical protein